MTADARSQGWFRRITGTLRFRITAIATLVVAVILVGAGVWLVDTQHEQLNENLEDSLRQRAHDLAAVVANGEATGGLAGFGGEDSAAQVVSPSGDVLAASSNLAGEPPMAGPPEDEDGVLSTRDDLPIDDSEFRVLSRRVRTPDGPVVLHLAANLDDIDDSPRILAQSLTLAIPAVVLLLAALIWWLVGRTLRPVEAIRAEVAHIGGRDLHRRVPQPSGTDEIARLARTMNTMLDRIEDATRRQQRFVADAAHELRSPLTRIRSELEVDEAHPGAADIEATHHSILDETIGLQRLVDDLLHLARSDAGVMTERSEDVDLDDIVLRQARRLRADGRVTVDLTDVSGAQVIGDPDQLTRAIRNLADNAGRHATSLVTFTLVEQDHVARLTVTDDGPGIPSGEHERVFARFTRLDAARSTGDGGSGLGLAITRDIIEAHGGTITIESQAGPGARFLVMLPLRGPRPGA